MPDKYTYAVARIHTKENNMLSLQELERLLAAEGMSEAFAFLGEKGYDTLNVETVDDLIRREREKMWKLISELVPDLSVFDIFLYETDFHNLKAAVKAFVTQDETEGVFIDGGTEDYSLINNAIKNREYDLLPEFLRETAEKAVKALLETGDGGICDIICDRAYLENCLKAAENSDNPMIRRFGELTVALADIRIAARGVRLGKMQSFSNGLWQSAGHSTRRCLALQQQRALRSLRIISQEPITVMRLKFSGHHILLLKNGVTTALWLK